MDYKFPKDGTEMIFLIKEACEEAGSQRELAKKWGISPAYLSDILKGKRLVSDTIAKKLGYRRTMSYIYLSD